MKMKAALWCLVKDDPELGRRMQARYLQSATLELDSDQDKDGQKDSKLKRSRTVEHIDMLKSSFFDSIQKKGGSRDRLINEREFRAFLNSIGEDVSKSDMKKLMEVNKDYFKFYQFVERDERTAIKKATIEKEF